MELDEKEAMVDELVIPGRDWDFQRQFQGERLATAAMVDGLVHDDLVDVSVLEEPYDLADGWELGELAVANLQSDSTLHFVPMPIASKGIAPTSYCPKFPLPMGQAKNCCQLYCPVH